MNAKRTGIGLAAMILTFALPMGASAQYQTDGIIYAFMQMPVGSSQQYALLPVQVPANTLRFGDPITATVPSAFNLLRQGKAATYGNTSIMFTDADANARRVTVNVDPSKAAYFDVIAAECVYTFTQLGIETVVFPGYNDGIGRDDIEYAAYRLQVPMWQALVVGEVHEADIELPNGDRMDADEFASDFAGGDPALQQMALDYLSGDNAVAQYNILLIAASLDLPGYEDRIVPLLAHDDAAYRQSALAALATSDDDDAWQAIVTMMNEDPDPAMRLAAAEALASAPVVSYQLYSMFFRAQEGDVDVRRQAIAQMAEVNDPRVDEALLGYLADPEPAIAESAVDTLTVREAWSTLQDAFEDDDLGAEVRLAAATSLANNADGAARLAGLRYRGFRVTGDLAIAVLDDLNGLGDVDPRTTIEEFLGHDDIDVRIHAADLLGERASRDSLDPLSTAASASDIDVDFRAALQDAAVSILLAQDTERVERYAIDNDTFLKGAAYRALGEMAQQGRAGGSVFRRLEDGLDDPSEDIREASALAMASYADQAALDALMAHVSDTSPRVLGAIALALGAFDDETYLDAVVPTVIGFAESGEPEIIAGAIEALGMLNQVQLRGLVIEKIGYPDPRVRGAAMRSAVMLVDPADTRDVINAVGGRLRDEDDDNRVLAARLLGNFSDDNAVFLVSEFVNDPLEELRYAAIDSLGRMGSQGGAMVLVSLLESPDREIRFAAMDALRELAMVSVVPDVQAVIEREGDPATADALRALVEDIQANGT